MRAIDGRPYDLGQWRGHVLLIVNVASRCHFTSQYSALEAIYERYRARGLVVIGVPANSFWNQEPGTNSDIQHFCTGVYHVTFPMLAKVEVAGDHICPLYRYLTTRSPFPGPIGWNFIKFLVDRHGRVVGRFGSFSDPDDDAVLTAIEQALGPAAAPAAGPAVHG